MTKGQLRETITELETLCSQWIKFRNFFNPENVTPALESEFNQIKSDITSRHRTLLSILEFDIELAQNMLDSLGRINTPRGGELLTPTTRKNLEDDWNSAYLLIQESLGLLDYRLGEKSLSTLFRGSRRKSTKEEKTTLSFRGMAPKRRGVSPLLKLVFVLILLGVVIWVLWQFNILQDYIPGL